MLPILLQLILACIFILMRPVVYYDHNINIIELSGMDYISTRRIQNIYAREKQNDELNYFREYDKKGFLLMKAIKD